jgi:hypothetical protein
MKPVIVFWGKACPEKGCFATDDDGERPWNAVDVLMQAIT